MQTNQEATRVEDRRKAELARQLLHCVSGLWPFCLRWIGPAPLIVLAASALVFNLWVLPRVGGRWLWRSAEISAGRSAGMVLYPLTVLVLLAVFYRRPEVAAAGWGLLAFGDGAATMVGQRWGKASLPWNPAKTWAGSIAYLVTGWIAVTVLVGWTAPGQYSWTVRVIVGGAAALLAALLESAPQGLDDNLRVPVVASLGLLCLLETQGRWDLLTEPSFGQGLLLGVLLNVALAYGAYLMATLDAAGAVVACLLGTVVFAFLSWQGYAILLTFFVLGSLSTRIGYDRKRRDRIAQARGGRRRYSNALANGSVAAACALGAGLTPHAPLFIAAFACTLGAAAADTVESEIGQVWGKPTVLITTWRSVSPGVDGGISALGTLAGLLAAVVTVAVGSIVGLYSVSWVLPLSLLAVVATLVESAVGATLEQAGLLDNNGVNFFNTLLAAVMGAGWVWIVG